MTGFSASNWSWIIQKRCRLRTPHWHFPVMKDAPMCTSTNDNINAISPPISQLSYLSLSPSLPLPERGWGGVCVFSLMDFLPHYSAQSSGRSLHSLSHCVVTVFPLWWRQLPRMHQGPTISLIPPQRSSTGAVGLSVTVTCCNLVPRFSLFLSYGWLLELWIV